MQTVPYIQFKHAIQQKLIDAELFCPEWFKTQEKRVSLYWNSGETVDSAYETLYFFAHAALSSDVARDINPLDPRICLGVTYV